MKKTSITTGLIQTHSSADVSDNLDRTEHLIEKAVSKGAEIICLQEIFASRYFCTVQRDTFFDLAEASDGPLITRFSAIAKKLKVVLVVPFFERRAAGIYHNSAAVIESDGSLLGVYRKMHIPDDPLYFEKYYFTPGDDSGPHGGFKVFSTSVGKVGVLICWDQWFPEAARITSLMGADILFYPTAIGWHPSEKAEFGDKQRDAWRIQQRAHAISNGVFVASVNRVGFEETVDTDGIEFFGHSFISSPFGELLADASAEEEVLVATCNLAKIEDTRRNWPFFRDRRVDAYGRILKRYASEGER